MKKTAHEKRIRTGSILSSGLSFRRESRRNDTSVKIPFGPIVKVTVPNGLEEETEKERDGGVLRKIGKVWKTRTSPAAAAGDGETVSQSKGARGENVGTRERGDVRNRRGRYGGERETDFEGGYYGEEEDEEEEEDEGRRIPPPPPISQSVPPPPPPVVVNPMMPMAMGARMMQQQSQPPPPPPPPPHP